MRQISNVPAAIFRSVHSTVHTAGTHARIPIDMTKMIKDVCNRMFSFMRNPVTACWQNDNHLQSFSCSGLWRSTDVNALDPYFRFQKTDKVFRHITPSLVMSVKHT
jgi:hypothetical protein